LVFKNEKFVEMETCYILFQNSNTMASVTVEDIQNARMLKNKEQVHGINAL